MTQEKSPRVSRRKSNERRKSSSAGLERMETSRVEIDEVDGPASGDPALKEDDDFVLRTVKEDQNISEVRPRRILSVPEGFSSCVWTDWFSTNGSETLFQPQ